MNIELLKNYLQKECAIELAQELSLEEMKEKLAQHINYLIGNNFQQLIALLYRVDVDETKLRSLLKDEPGKDAGNTIAQLMIERQLQKIQSREQFKGNNTASGEEKW